MSHEPRLLQTSVSWKFAVVFLVTLAAAALLDEPVARWALSRDVRTERLDLVKALRSAGYLPTWLVAAIALILVDRINTGRLGRLALKRGAALALAPTIAGALTEILKLLLRRERPELTAGWYHFRNFLDRPLSTAGLAMPSSHAAVAFAGAFVLARLFPPAAPVWFLVAVGTALTRVIAGAHFLSDICMSVFVGGYAASLAYKCVSRATEESGIQPREIGRYWPGTSGETSQSSAPPIQGKAGRM